MAFMTTQADIPGQPAADARAVEASSLLPDRARVFVAGHRGLVGSAVARRLTAVGHRVLARTRAELEAHGAKAIAAHPRDVLALAAP